MTALAASVALLVTTAGPALADGTGPSDPGRDPSGSLSQPFLDWGDTASYALAPDGNFTQGLGSWTITGAAGLTQGSDPWSDGGSDSGASLELPAGSSAISPVVSIATDEPAVRFFTVNHGDPSSLLAVSVSFTTIAGIPVTLPLDTISSDGSWAPSPKVWLLINNLAGGGSLPVQFSFTPVGDGDWQIDDLYIDPWAET